MTYLLKQIIDNYIIKVETRKGQKMKVNGFFRDI